MLQVVDLATGDGLEPSGGRAVAGRGRPRARGRSCSTSCRSALASETSCGGPPPASTGARPTSGRPLDDGTVLEGFVDLVYRDDDGSLVVVDYKTDAVPSAALPARVRVYLPQMAAYAKALEPATGQDVHRATLLFLSPQASTARELDASDWAGALPASVTG